MRTINKIYYHLQRINEKNIHWKIGDIIEFNKNIENYYFYSLNESILSFHESLSEQNLKTQIRDLEQKIKSETVKQIDNPELTFDNQFIINSIEIQIDEIKCYYDKCIQLQQEIIFENIKNKINIELPSRQHCIWVTENINELCQWIKMFEDQPSRILKLRLNGNIHTTSGEFIDIIKNKNIKNAISNAKEYWQGTSNNKVNEIEYLFEGKVEIIDII